IVWWKRMEQCRAERVLSIERCDRMSAIHLNTRLCYTGIELRSRRIQRCHNCQLSRRVGFSDRYVQHMCGRRCDTSISSECGGQCFIFLFINQLICELPRESVQCRQRSHTIVPIITARHTVSLQCGFQWRSVPERYQ